MSKDGRVSLQFIANSGCYVVGDKAGFTRHEADKLIRVGAAVEIEGGRPIPATPLVDAKEKVDTAPQAITTHEVNAREAVDMIKAVDDVETLAKLEQSERSHPEYAGGRGSVLKAIAAKYAEIK